MNLDANKPCFDHKPNKFTLELPDPATAVAADSTEAPSINVEESADLEAYVDYYFVAVIMAPALPLTISEYLHYSDRNVTIAVYSLAICFFASGAFFFSLARDLSHKDQINTHTFRIRKLLGSLTSLCGLCLLFIVVSYINSAAPASLA
ncbi:transmembrane protein, putative [Medicago truncatula]|uniref:Transmembrane protein, putative n=1 Tax=Medicago truncatula TaxID=3880 RepID=G7J935_MEDTR|nr:transmembrane protein, putative [Medicago truncatula]